MPPAMLPAAESRNSKPAPLRALAAALLLAAFLRVPSAFPAAARSVEALPESDGYALLASVQAMHRAQCPSDGPSVIVFETGGGDPAMNGAFLYLRLDLAERSFVWKTGLNVRRVLGLSCGPGDSVLILAEEDAMDARQNIVTRQTAWRVRFALERGNLRPVVAVEPAPKP
ncbi:hypothetical protein NNJEOMEG_00753 [Fundidesulfovibrio magnetotacticus]|uniref:Uncharacterized protein n=1 Tax=Fundidesulfovibrio magnetotacticus TaxID=2730080 RepID=A0A6V8LXB8_9BACT|nr:hypothetical protein [Fundidesulfovibrio magnetotacticus]GFK92925.1 hypothetical protein NNJEOMEG_00753 [Fundidesulfovibrio magnetotacticus]